MPGSFHIPLGLLTIVDNEVFFVDGCGEDICFRRIFYRIEGVGAGFGEHLGGEETESVALKAGVAHRSATVAQIATTSHHVPPSGVVALSVGFIVGVVDIAQANHVGEFVANGADAIKNNGALRLPSVALGGAGIGAILHAIVAPKSVARQRRFVRPEIIGIVAGIVGTKARCNEVNHIHIAITVGIVFAIIYRRIKGLEGFIECRGSIGKLLNVGGSIAHGYGSHHIELGCEFAVTIVGKIVAHTAQEH